MKTTKGKVLKSIATISILSFLGTLSIVFTYNKGVNLGKEIGKCEVACLVSNGKFIALLEDNYCQCVSKGGIKWIYAVKPDIGLEE